MAVSAGGAITFRDVVFSGLRGTKTGTPIGEFSGCDTCPRLRAFPDPEGDGLGIKPRKVSERCPDAVHEPHSHGWADDRATAKTTIPRQTIRRFWHIGGVCPSSFRPHRHTERNDDI